jgi:hypothetical protein
MLRAPLAVAVLAALAACSDAAPPTAPDAGRPLLAASTLNDNQIVPLDLVVFVDCADGGAGELVALSGRLHAIVQITESSSGNYHVRTHFQPQDLAGVGLTTGDRYRGTGVTQDQLVINGVFPMTYTYVNNFRMIGQGPGNNFQVHENYHLTINANGVVTVDRDNFSSSCG